MRISDWSSDVCSSDLTYQLYSVSCQNEAITSNPSCTHARRLRGYRSRQAVAPEDPRHPDRSFRHADKVAAKKMGGSLPLPAVGLPGLLSHCHKPFAVRRPARTTVE